MCSPVNGIKKMSLIRLNIPKLHLKRYPVLYSIVRNHYNKDYKPRAYPKTIEERKAAAKRYNMDFEVYKPYPNDGSGLGDYPKLPLESGDSKDPFYPWDNPELKRNFNEPIDANADMIGEDRYDVNFRHRIPLPKLFLQFVVFMGTTCAVYLYCEKLKWFLAIAEKQYPSSGDKHYLFEEGK